MFFIISLLIVVAAVEAMDKQHREKTSLVNLSREPAGLWISMCAVIPFFTVHMLIHGPALLIHKSTAEASEYQCSKWSSSGAFIGGAKPT